MDLATKEEISGVKSCVSTASFDTAPVVFKATFNFSLRFLSLMEIRIVMAPLFDEDTPKAFPFTLAAGPKASAVERKRAKAIELASFMVKTLIVAISRSNKRNKTEKALVDAVVVVVVDDGWTSRVATMTMMDF